MNCAGSERPMGESERDRPYGFWIIIYEERKTEDKPGCGLENKYEKQIKEISRVFINSIHVAYVLQKHLLLVKFHEDADLNSYFSSFSCKSNEETS
jgi:hypothetical protein